MRILGYNDAYIHWMCYVHDQDNRILLISETIKNATKLGIKIRGHYEATISFDHSSLRLFQTKHVFGQQILYNINVPEVVRLMVKERMILLESVPLYNLGTIK